MSFDTAAFLAQKYGHVLLTQEEVAAELRIGVKTLQNKAAAGEIDIRKKPGQLLYHVADVAEVIDSRRCGSAASPAEAGCSAAGSASPSGPFSVRPPESGAPARKSAKSPHGGGRGSGGPRFPRVSAPG
jgi:hypothetical protein